MGLILDSSVVIASERQGTTLAMMIERVISAAGDEDAALTAIGLTELIHGIYRTPTSERRSHREAFIHEMLRALTVCPYTKETALLAGKIDGEQRAQGMTIPFSDLLIGATALSLGFPLLTVNTRHFGMIPGLTVIPF